jgi:hypothetical protein
MKIPIIVFEPITEIRVSSAEVKYLPDTGKIQIDRTGKDLLLRNRPQWTVFTLFTRKRVVKGVEPTYFDHSSFTQLVGFGGTKAEAINDLLVKVRKDFDLLVDIDMLRVEKEPLLVDDSSVEMLEVEGT